MTRAVRDRPPRVPGAGPLRMCVGCRVIRFQADLLRLVRGPDGLVEPDVTRRRGGRGAYICQRSECLDGAVRRQAFGHAFRTPVRMAPAGISALRAILDGPGLDGKADVISSKGGR